MHCEYEVRLHAAEPFTSTAGHDHTAGQPIRVLVCSHEPHMACMQACMQDSARHASPFPAASRPSSSAGTLPVPKASPSTPSAPGGAKKKTRRALGRPGRRQTKQPVQKRARRATGKLNTEKTCQTSGPQHPSQSAYLALVAMEGRKGPQRPGQQRGRRQGERRPFPLPFPAPWRPHLSSHARRLLAAIRLDCGGWPWVPVFCFNVSRRARPCFVSAAPSGCISSDWQRRKRKQKEGRERQGRAKETKEGPDLVLGLSVSFSCRRPTRAVNTRRVRAASSQRRRPPPACRLF